MIDPISLKSAAGLLFGCISITASTISVLVYKEQIQDFFTGKSNLPKNMIEMGEKLTLEQLSISHSWIINSTFLVKKSTTTNSANSTDKKLYETVGEKKVKKFKCKTTDQKFDDDCEIYELEKNQNDLIDVQKINESWTKPETLDQTTKYYKLEIKNSLFKDKKFEKISTIDIVSKEKEDEVWHTFDVDYKVKDNMIEGKTNLYVAEMLPENTKASNPTFTCSFEKANKNDTNECKLFGIDQSIKEIKDISFKGKINEIKEFNNQQNNVFFVVDIKNKMNVAKFPKSLPIYITWRKNRKIIKTFEVKAFLSTTVSDFSASNFSEVIFLNN